MRGRHRDVGAERPGERPDRVEPGRGQRQPPGDGRDEPARAEAADDADDELLGEQGDPPGRAVSGALRDLDEADHEHRRDRVVDAALDLEHGAQPPRAAAAGGRRSSTAAASVDETIAPSRRPALTGRSTSRCAASADDDAP